MSDNLPPEVVQQELDARFRIPTEVWTDVFKLLPRRILVQKIAPACYRFKEISDKNVKNIHVIRNADHFAHNLEGQSSRPQAVQKSIVQKLEHLAGNKCKLAGQFKLTRVSISEKNQAILRYCPDLFVGCRISFSSDKYWTYALECLDQLEKAEPIMIRVIQRGDQVIDFWHNPTFQNCTRVDLHFKSYGLSDATLMNIIEWLHRQPSGMDCDASASTDEQQVRGMIISYDDGRGHNHIHWLLDRCSQDIQQARNPTDRRPFMLAFRCRCWDWTGIDQSRRIENKSTGEAFVLDRVGVMNDRAFFEYRLRRCLIEEVANGPEFFAGMLKRNKGYDQFRIGDETPKVVIE